MIIFSCLFALLNAFAREFQLSTPDSEINLNPRYIERNSNLFVLGNLYRGYFTYDDKLGLVGDLAKECRWIHNKKLSCALRDNKYSNGEAISLVDYQNAFVQLFSDARMHRAASQFRAIKNAQKILLRKESVSSLGVQVVKPNKIIFDLEHLDADFIYRLTSPAITPLPDDPNIVVYTGPYVLSAKKPDFFLLKPNNYYFKSNFRPDVRVRVVPESLTAMNLYKKKMLDFVWQVPTERYKEFESNDEFKFQKLLRFDYVGLAGKLANDEPMRKRITESINYNDFQRVFLNPGEFGCFGIQLNKNPCLQFRPIKSESTEKYLFYIAKQFDSNIRRTAEWFQGSLKKYANINLEIREEEFQLMTARLKTSPPDMFRRGVPLDRPTCLNGLEVFYSNSLDNYVGFKNEIFDKNIERLKDPNVLKNKIDEICRDSIRILISSSRVIPLGAIHFGTLVSSSFTGVKLNSLGQLDLSELQTIK